MKNNGMSPSRVNRFLVTARTFLTFGMENYEYADEFEDFKVN